MCSESIAEEKWEPSEIEIPVSCSDMKLFFLPSLSGSSQDMYSLLHLHPLQGAGLFVFCQFHQMEL